MWFAPLCYNRLETLNKFHFLALITVYVRSIGQIHNLKDVAKLSDTTSAFQSVHCRETCQVASPRAWAALAASRIPWDATWRDRCSYTFGRLA